MTLNMYIVLKGAASVKASSLESVISNSRRRSAEQSGAVMAL